MLARFLLVIPLLVTAAKAEISAPIPIPAQAMPMSVEVPRAGTAKIILRAYGTSNQQLKFKIRVQPTLGRLSEPLNATAESAIVIYEHAGAAEPVNDRFTYVAQSHDGVSAPAEVQIKIIDEPPILAVPDEIAFKNVLPGSTAMRNFTIENRGGGILAGVITAPDGWKLRGHANYQLDHGDSATFTLVFAPAEEREYRGELRYSSNPDRTTFLTGSGFYPIVAQPAAFALHAQGTMRTGVLTLENRTADAQMVRITTGDRLRAPAQIEVAARGKTTLTVESKNDDVRAFDDKLQIATDDFATTINVHVDAFGAILRTGTDTVAFSKTADGQMRAEATVENIGGSPGDVTASISQPFVIDESDRTFSLAPGDKRTVHLSVKPPANQQYRTLLTFAAGDSRAQAIVFAEGERTRFTAPAQLNVSSGEAPQPPDETFSNVPPIRSCSIDDISRTSARLHWRAPSDEPLRYIIEQRLLSLRDNELRIDWQPLKNVEVRQNGPAVEAAITGLRPGTLYSLRITSIDPRGQRSIPTWMPLDFFTAAPKPFNWRGLLWPVLLVLLVALAWRKVR